jgi:FKBP-type peptidyl-prolyl cis-trans isomerase SlyD
MQIEADSIVTFHYTLTDEAGLELETNHTEEPQACLMGRRNILAGLEEAMLGKSVGETLQVTLPPQRAYGKRQENAQHRVPIKHLIKAPKKIIAGQIVHLNTKDGTRNARVIKVGRFNIDVDSNHPFAGQTLTFVIDIVDVRSASRDELAHGHAHGAGGHHH